MSVKPINEQMSSERLDKLTDIVSKGSGIDRGRLTEMIKSGKIDGILAGLSDDDRKKLTFMMKNPAAAKAALSKQENKDQLLKILGEK